MGEGCAILVLKRLSDAERDGDRIYATIRGIGSSSDGKGKGITAPNQGQRLALQRAYQNAGVSIDSVAYFECHGTSTQVSDKVEASVLAESLNAPQTKPHLGSIQSNIRHLKNAAVRQQWSRCPIALPPNIVCNRKCQHTSSRYPVG